MQKRITWLDAMKGFMIIFVVLCHSLVLNRGLGVQGHFDSMILYAINTFIMPCFFAVSGFLYQRVQSWYQYKTLWYKKLTGLLIPYLIFSVLLHYYMHAPTSLLSIVYQPIFLMWFLLALFFIFIIVGTLDLMRVPIGFQLIIYLIALMVQPQLNWWVGPDYDMNIVTCTAGYLIFFYLGYLIKRYFKFFKCFLNQKRITILLFIVLIMGLVIQARYTGVFPYNTDQVLYSDVITKLISTLAFFSLFMTFDKELVHNWLNMIGRSTLVVYLVHYFFLHTVFMWIMSNQNVYSSILQSGIRFIVGLLGSLIVIWLVKRVKIFQVIFYPRHYLDPLWFGSE